MNSLFVAGNVLVLFALIFIGYIALLIGIFDRESARHLSRFILDVSLPALIITSMQVPLTPEFIQGLKELIIAIGVFYAVSFIIAWSVPQAIESSMAEEKVFHFSLIFSNVVYMGFPVIQSLFGTTGLFYAAIFNLPFRLLIFTMGVLLLTGSTERKSRFDLRALSSPPILASLIGLVLFLASIKIPSPLLDVLDILGSVTTPLAMIVIGIILAGFPIREMFLGWKVYLVSAIRLLAIPYLLWLLLSTLYPNSLVNSVVIILAAMPVASTCALLAGEYEANPFLASRVVFISTLGSVVTIPIIASLLL